MISSVDALQILKLSRRHDQRPNSVNLQNTKETQINGKASWVSLARSLSKDKMSVLPYKSQVYFLVLKHTSPKGNEGILVLSIPKQNKLPRKEFN